MPALRDPPGSPTETQTVLSGDSERASKVLALMNHLRETNRIKEMIKKLLSIQLLAGLVFGGCTTRYTVNPNPAKPDGFLFMTHSGKVFPNSQILLYIDPKISTLKETLSDSSLIFTDIHEIDIGESLSNTIKEALSHCFNKLILVPKLPEKIEDDGLLCFYYRKSDLPSLNKRDFFGSLIYSGKYTIELRCELIGNLEKLINDPRVQVKETDTQEVMSSKKQFKENLRTILEKSGGTIGVETILAEWEVIPDAACGKETTINDLFRTTTQQIATKIFEMMYNNKSFYNYFTLVEKTKS